MVIVMVMFAWHGIWNTEHFRHNRMMQGIGLMDDVERTALSAHCVFNAQWNFPLFTIEGTSWCF